MFYSFTSGGSGFQGVRKDFSVRSKSNNILLHVDSGEMVVSANNIIVSAEFYRSIISFHTHIFSFIEIRIIQTNAFCVGRKVAQTAQLDEHWQLKKILALAWAYFSLDRS